MARYKYIDTSPRFLPVDLSQQLIPGTIEHAVNHLIEHVLDLAAFDARFQNDENGAPAYPPAMLLKVVLVAYAHGVISSRQIARLCQENVTFIALTGDTHPHFTTIADFISTLRDPIARVFAAVVGICDEEGLIGKQMFAIDGVKLPSNASKHRSGTIADFERRATKLEATAKEILARHRAADGLPVEPTLAAKEKARVEALETDAAKIRDWLARNPTDRHGPTGGVRKSNLTDNESAKLATEKGVIQGYTGVAVVDALSQIIVEAQAHGTGSEREVLLGVIDAMQERERLLTPESVILADAGFHSEDVLAGLAEREVDALIADREMRQRDERFATQEVHKDQPDPLHDKSKRSRKLPLYGPADFTYDPVARTCVCPAGKSLYRQGQANVTNAQVNEAFRGTKRDCVPCAQRAQCLRKPEKTAVRQVAFFRGRDPEAPPTYTVQMKARIDSPEGRAVYAIRFGAVEPVFGNLCANKGLDRFTLRGRPKVTGQFTLYCLVHNIEKLARHGYAQ